MRQIRFIFLVVFGLLLTGSQAVHGVTIDFNPADLNLTKGDIFSVDLVISGLYGDTFGDSGRFGDDLSTFDLNVNFDPAMLTFNSYTLGDELGSILNGDAEDLSFGNFVDGMINLSGLSWLDDLSAQPDAFTLAVLSFTANVDGNTSLSLSNVILGDFYGNNLVPEPATLWFLGMGLAWLVIIGRSRLQKS